MGDKALLQEIKDRSLELPASLRSIADFLLLEGSGVKDMTMAGLARATYTSKPTLVRFAKTLGYTGWPEFRVAFLKETQAAEAQAEQLTGVDVNYPFGPDDPCSTAARSTMRVRKLAAKHVAERLDDTLLASAAVALDAAEFVTFLSRPPTSYYGSSFAFKLTTLGKRCWVPHVEEADYSHRLLGSKNNAALFCSYSGKLVKEPFTLLEPMRQQGSTIVAVTSDGSPLAQAANIALTYPPIERYYDKVAGIYSCTCTDLWLDALFSAYYLRHYANFASTRTQRISQFEAITNIRDDLAAGR